jgi:CheY-like chemotaxis protein
MGENGRRARPTVLFADDCAAMRAAAAETLGNAGFSVIVATDGFSAVGVAADPARRRRIDRGRYSHARPTRLGYDQVRPPVRF